MTTLETTQVMRPDPYALGWAAVGATGIGYEVALALTGNRHHTLTAYLRRALGFDPRRSWAPAGATALGLGVFWAGLHVGLNILPSAPTAPPQAAV